MNYFNNTSVKIILRAFDYIGAFTVICSVEGKQHINARSNVSIGKPPGLLMRHKRCVVHYDRYIECTIIAPVFVRAFTNHLSSRIDFFERPLFSRPRIYRPSPKLVSIDLLNQTITYRWLPEFSYYFPSKLKMNVTATIQPFGSSTYLMDMTPIFRITSNFNLVNSTPITLKIEFTHRESQFVSFCYGNITMKNSVNSNEEEIRLIHETNSTSLDLTSLSPDTWYRICFYCYRKQPIDTISDLVCHQYKTSKLSNILQDFSSKIFHKNWVWLIASCGLLLCVILIYVLFAFFKKRKWNWLKGNTKQSSICRKSDNVIIARQSSVPLIVPMVTGVVGE
ncbi:unnamed protein product [Adineta ricciae]|uniref:Uncharacterized protein n=1 Tax=Adineta ricciae TaxID=249248 RepID=A0A813U004_ADIRI|nr:unnamed protein product [Adineta ricciae]